MLSRHMTPKAVQNEQKEIRAPRKSKRQAHADAGLPCLRHGALCFRGGCRGGRSMKIRKSIQCACQNSILINLRVGKTVRGEVCKAGAI